MCFLLGGDAEDDSNDNTDTEEEEKLHLSSLSWLGDLEVGAGSGEKESLIQRFLRLRCEVGELVEELDSMTESSREADSQSQGLSIQVKTLSKQLESCHLDQENSATSTGVTLEALNHQIEAMKNVKEKNKKEVNDGVYELYLSGEADRVSYDMSSLDGRLAVLEKVVGNNSLTDRKVLSAPTDDKNLVDAVKILDGRKSLLNQQHIDHVEGRLSALTFKVNSIGEQKGAVEMANKDDKLNKLDSLVSSQSHLAAGLLPQLVERMELVAQLQEGSKSWQDVVDGVEQRQRETKDVIADTEKQVVDAKEHFDNNLAGIQDNFKLLQKKLLVIPSRLVCTILRSTGTESVHFPVPVPMYGNGNGT